MSGPEQLSLFDAALVAFQIRFEQELVRRWEELEWKTGLAIVDALPAAKRRSLEVFFDDVAEMIAGVVHKYFPSLLMVATVHRNHLGDLSPLSWTQAQVLAQACNFLGIEEQFDHTTAPREDSLVLEATERITRRTGYADDGSSSEFRLPQWVVTAPHPMDRLRKPSVISDAEPLPRADTLKWVKQKEFWIQRRLQRQIEDESLDGIIEAGRGHFSVLEPPRKVEAASAGREIALPAVKPENRFITDGATWLIAFDGEVCRLPRNWLGLEYISVLLQYPGKPIRALRLLSLASGVPAMSHSPAERGTEFDRVPDEDFSTGRGNLDRDLVVDDKAVEQLKRRLSELEIDITHRLEIGDKSGAQKLEEERAKIQNYLDGSIGIHRRPRTFPDEHEKARVSITNALTRAYGALRKYAPKTADYLERQILTGSEFTYRDNSTPWQVRRTL